MKNFDYIDYFKTEYSEADMEYYLTKKRVSCLKRLKEMLLSDRVMVFTPGNEAYSYFLDEYRNEISFEGNNIIIPTESIKTLR